MKHSPPAPEAPKSAKPPAHESEFDEVGSPKDETGKRSGNRYRIRERPVTPQQVARPHRAPPARSQLRAARRRLVAEAHVCLQRPLDRPQPHPRREAPALAFRFVRAASQTTSHRTSGNASTAGTAFARTV